MAEFDSESTPPTVDDAPVACNVCRRDIPLSTAMNPEGEQYVEYYCGLDCYETWFHKRCETEYPAAIDYEWPAPRAWTASSGR